MHRRSASLLLDGQRFRQDLPRARRGRPRVRPTAPHGQHLRPGPIARRGGIDEGPPPGDRREKCEGRARPGRGPVRVAGGSALGGLESGSGRGRPRHSRRRTGRHGRPVPHHFSPRISARLDRYSSSVTSPSFFRPSSFRSLASKSGATSVAGGVVSVSISTTPLRDLR